MVKEKRHSLSKHRCAEERKRIFNAKEPIEYINKKIEEYTGEFLKDELFLFID